MGASHYVTHPADAFIQGGDMGALMRAHDWSRTELGPVAGWPPSLISAVNLVLNSGSPAFVGWGPRYVTLYNDAIRRLLKPQHPISLAQPGREVWGQIWRTIGPLIDQVQQTGIPVRSPDLQVTFDRQVPREESYFDISVDPIRDGTGIAGVLCTLTETTTRVLQARRLNTLSEIARRGIEQGTMEETCISAAQVLKANSQDVPFSLFYLVEEDRKALRLAAASGLEPGSPAAPLVMSLERPTVVENRWPILHPMTTGAPESVTDLLFRFGPLYSGPWPEGTEAATMHPITATVGGRPAGLLVMGMSPRRPTDDPYLEFLRDVGVQVSQSLATVRSSEAENDRNKALVESESRYAAVRRATNDVIWDWDLRNDQVTWSAAAFQQFGYTELELGSTRREWVGLIHAEDRGRVLRSILEAMERGSETWNDEYRFRRKDGTYGTFLDRAVILRDDTGRAIRLVGSMLNVTHRRALEEEVRHAQKMQAVGKLAGGMAHEVNNMMTAVLGFGDLILQKLPPEHPQRSDVEEIVKAGERAAKVTQQLLAFTRQQAQQARTYDMNRVVLDMRRMLERMLGADIPLLLQLAPSLPPVRLDRSQFEQLLVNLVHNAHDAMPAGGQVSIETSQVTLDAERQRRHPGVPLRLGRYVQLRIRDTGSGMDETTQRRAFEPFFTTKPVGKGTGLGLSTAYGTIKQSDGYIWLTSEASKGTTITIQLPVANASDEDTPISPAPSLSGAETVLIVEDEQMVLTMARRALEGEGYLVLEARDGKEALEVMRAFGDQVRLVLTDIVMPRLGGRELGAELKVSAPGVPVLYMSAYTGDEVMQRGQLEPGAPFIQKPFTPFVLLRRIRDLLDQAPITRFDALS